MPSLILLRHGESMWNPPKSKSGASSRPPKGWRYAGAIDVPLSVDGIEEAIQAGKRLKEIPINLVYCSMLMRAQMTALIALASHDFEQTPIIVRDEPNPNIPRGLRVHKSRIYTPELGDDEETNGEAESETNRVIPVYCSNALNERDFGELQGMHNREQKRRFRADQLEAWRCGWDDRFPGDHGESSKDVYARVVGFFERHIRAQLEAGNNIMMVTHGFVQRVLIKHLIGMSDADWTVHMKLESHADPKMRRSSRLLAQNAVPVIFSYAKSEGSDAAAVRVDTLVSGLEELFRDEDEGMYQNVPDQGNAKARVKSKL